MNCRLSSVVMREIKSLYISPNIPSGNTELAVAFSLLLIYHYHLHETNSVQTEPANLNPMRQETSIASNSEIVTSCSSPSQLTFQKTEKKNLWFSSINNIMLSVRNDDGLLVTYRLSKFLFRHHLETEIFFLKTFSKKFGFWNLPSV
jgi:hypothetical protein